MKMLIVIPYFGNWPAWMEYFLQSCAYNPSFHWLLYTNGKEPVDCPRNIRFECKALRDFNTLASQKLGLHIEIIHPYKICDLRPAFGHIFSDYLDGYDFWGYADLDIIFGNISSFLPDELLKIFDVFSVRKEYMAGHFALYRNTPFINSLYTKSASYKQIFQDSDRHYAFDERSNILGKKLYKKYDATRWQVINFASSFIRKVRLRLNPALKDIEFPDMTTITRKSSDIGEMKFYQKDLVRSDLWFEKQNMNQWKIVWKNGIISDCKTGENFLHFHFIKSKRKKNFKIESFKPDAEFRIRPTGIMPGQNKD